MSDYTIVVERSRKRLAQRYFVSIAASNGEKLFTSEMLRDKAYAVELGHKITEALDGNFIDGTGG